MGLLYKTQLDHILCKLAYVLQLDFNQDLLFLYYFCTIFQVIWVFNQDIGSMQFVSTQTRYQLTPK